MLGVPYRRFVIELERGREIAFLERLRNSTQIRSWLCWRRRPPQIRFEGTVSDVGFRLVPMIKGRNTYLPCIRGKILSKNGSAVVDVRMTLHPIAALFMLAFVGWGEYLAITKEGALNLPFLGMFIVLHVGLYFIGFLPEAKKAEQWLRSNSTADSLDIERA